MRLTKIITHNGDGGFSHLADGTKLAKNHLIFAILGDLDELNSYLGLLISNLEISTNPQNLQNFLPNLYEIQRNLFVIGGEISMQQLNFSFQHAENIENLSKQIQQSLTPLREFILPSGNQIACYCHLCRTIARRCERSLVNLIFSNKKNSESEKIKDARQIYLNRLADLFFVLARWINKEFQQQEIFWK